MQDNASETVPSKSPINILHLSDLHFSTGHGAFDQSVVLDALKSDLKLVCRGSSRPDIVIFSGDLARAGDSPDTYFSAYEQVLEPLAGIAGCSEKRVFLCPGNHDAERAYIEANISDHEGMFADLKDRNTLNAAYLSGKVLPYAWNKFLRFRELNQFFCENKILIDDGIIRLEQVGGINVDILTVNSAWLTSAGLPQFPKDERRLAIPEAAIVQAKKLLRPDALKVLVTHHPNEWLADFNRSDFEAAIGGVFHLHLFGHVHELEPKNITASKGSSVSNQAGALYQGRDRYNGYSLISIDPDWKFLRIRARSYFPKTGQFDEGVDVLSNGGVFYSSDEAKRYWWSRSKIVDPEEVKTWIGDQLLPAAQKAYGETISDRAMEELFVSPPMYRKVVTAGEVDGIPEREELPITMGQVISSASNFVIYGRQEYGKTTLLQQIALGLMREVKAETIPPIVPVILDFNLIKKGTRALQRQAQAALVAELGDFNLTTLLENGFAAILVDDVEFGSETRWTLLKAFMQQYPRNRFIFTSTPGSSEGLIAALSSDVVVNTNTPQFFEHVFLQAFNRAKLRHLVKRWDPGGSLDQENILNRMVSEMTGMNIPITAVNGTILLAIYESKASFKPINRAALVEQFVEYALEKRALDAVFRGSFDYKNKEYLLAMLAATMAQENEYILPWQKAVSILGASLNAIGLNYDVEAILRLFVSVRVLRLRSDDCISFRYRAFLEYFIACRMRDNISFRDWVLDEQRYLRFGNEVLYYAGLVRNADDLLEMIGVRFADLTVRASEKGEWVPDLNQLNSFSPPHDDADGDIFDEFAKQMDMPAYTESERDAVLDAELPLDVEDRQEVYRPKLDELGQQWTVALMLYSGALKNLELIPDQTKRRHLRSLLLAWGNLTAVSLSLVPQIARNRGARINGVSYEVRMPKHFSEQKIARLIAFDMPRSISQMLFRVMGTEKLERQLSEPQLEDADEPLIAQFYRTTLIGLLRLGGWLNALRKLEVTLLSKSRFLSEGLLRSLSDMYFLGGHGKDDEKELARLLGDASTKLRGVSGKSMLDDRGLAIQNVSKRGLLRRLKSQALDNDPGEQ